MSKRSKTVKNVQRLWTITCLLCTLIVLIGCDQDKIKPWTWEPHAYLAYSDTQTLEDASDDVVKCTDKRFEEFTCFPEDNIVQLKINIEKMKDNQNNHKANLIAVKMYLNEKKVMTPELEQYLSLDNLEQIDRGLEETLELLP